MRCPVVTLQRPCTSAPSVGFLDRVCKRNALRCRYEPAALYVSPQCWFLLCVHPQRWFFLTEFLSGALYAAVVSQCSRTSVLCVGFSCPFVSGKYCCVVIHRWPCASVVFLSIRKRNALRIVLSQWSCASVLGVGFCD